MEERLQNILAHRGVASRRHSAAMIEEGRVTVDGVVCTEPGARFDPEKVLVRVDGRVLAVVAEKSRTIMMYKPVGVLSSASDPFGGTTVIDLIKGRVPERLVPVGRLDKDSEGLILLSNDGDLSLKLTHPRYEHEKVYVVRAAGRWRDQMLETLALPGEQCSSAAVSSQGGAQAADPLHVQRGASCGALLEAGGDRRVASG